MPPATVALFCICIAFVPLLALGGVAGYLFRPLAMAVVFAMIASYILTYTLVPTMAHFLLRNQHRHSGTRRAGRAAARVGLFARFQRGFERHFERLRQGYLGLLQLALQHRLLVRRRLPRASPCCLSASRPISDRTSSRRSTPARSRSICARRPEPGSRKRRALADQVEQKIRTIIPPSRLASIVDNIGLPISGINISYGNSGTIGVFDADILVTLNEGPTPTDVYVKTLREQLPKAFPGTTFSFLPADIVSQILNFGSPAPIDVQIAGPDLAASRAFAEQAARQDPPCPGRRRSPHPGSVPGSRD